VLACATEGVSAVGNGRPEEEGGEGRTHAGLGSRSGTLVMGRAGHVVSVQMLWDEGETARCDSQDAMQITNGGKAGAVAAPDRQTARQTVAFRVHEPPPPFSPGDHECRNRWRAMEWKGREAVLAVRSRAMRCDAIASRICMYVCA